MSMSVQVPVTEASPDPAPSAEWFAHMAAVGTDTEREVEMHFASPLYLWAPLAVSPNQIHQAADVSAGGIDSLEDAVLAHDASG